MAILRTEIVSHRTPLSISLVCPLDIQLLDPGLEGRALDPKPRGSPRFTTDFASANP
jgi:hypothetical protein